MVKEILRRKRILEIFAFSNSTLYAQMAEGVFPRPDIKLGKRVVGWSNQLIEEHQNKIRVAPAEKAA